MFYQQCIILECLYARQEFLSITFSLFPHLGIITMKVCYKFFLFLFFITHFSDCTSKFNKLLSILYIYIFRNMNICFVDRACQTIKVHLKNRVLTSQEKKQGLYQLSSTINGKPSWISVFQVKFQKLLGSTRIVGISQV